MSSRMGHVPNRMEEVKLFTGPDDREMYDNMAEVYAIVMSLQALERAFMKDCITQDLYTSRCTKLLGQYKTAWRVSKSSSESTPNTIEEFLRKYRLDAPLALERIRNDRPLTIKDDKGNAGKLIAECSCSYITVANYLELNMTAADDLLNDVKNLYIQLTRMSSLPNDSEAVTLVHKWNEQLKTMSATETLDEDQTRQMKLDIQQAHSAFDTFLESM